MSALIKQQRGVRLSDETWSALRVAAIGGSVSTASLMESLGSLWLNARDGQELWAEAVMERAQVIQREVNRARMTRKGEKSPETPKNGG